MGRNCFVAGLRDRDPICGTVPRNAGRLASMQIDLENYTAKLTAHMSDAWAMACDNVRKAKKKQKRHYDRKSKQPDLKVGDRVMVYFPNVVRGKAWKFARADRPADDTIFVALERVRPCYAEMTDDVWVGHGGRKPTKRTRKQSTQMVTNAESTYTGPTTRSRSGKTPTCD